jgi:S-formylglutathione hydrolase
MTLETLAEHRCHGGLLGFYRHTAESCNGPMRFGLYRPPQALTQGRSCPVLMCLAGLTCNEETFLIKSGAIAHAAQLGLALLAPDTSPRETGIEGEAADWEFGSAASFYLDATVEPWSLHFRMQSWLTSELPALLQSELQLGTERMSVLGHSMGGHGALTLALKFPQLFRSVSAFAPICAPTQVPWGQKALPRYLGDDPALWAQHDTVALLEQGRFPGTLLIDQGEADKFLHSQLRPDLLEAICARVGQALQLRRHAGYDHSYWFIQSFVAEHLQFHAAALR